MRTWLVAAAAAAAFMLWKEERCSASCNTKTKMERRFFTTCAATEGEYKITKQLMGGGRVFLENSKTVDYVNKKLNKKGIIYILLKVIFSIFCLFNLKRR